jgi:hypothetical protein
MLVANNTPLMNKSANFIFVILSIKPPDSICGAGAGAGATAGAGAGATTCAGADTSTCVSILSFFN